MVQRILLLCSADNGLTRRARLALQRRGHRVRTAVVTDSADIENAVAAADFDIVICPFLTAAIPASVYRRWWPNVVVIHPGPVGDRGPSSLDWAIHDQEIQWGVIGLTATEQMDAGPIWATRTFRLPADRRKSDIYNSVVADAAVQIILEIADKAADPTFEPVDQDQLCRPVPHARTRPLMRQTDRAFDWADDPELILRRIRAGDGSPGVRSQIAGHSVYLHDAHPGRTVVNAPAGSVIGRRHHAIEIACGDHHSIWIGHLRADLGDRWSCKAPATTALGRAGFPIGSLPATNPDVTTFRDITYRVSADNLLGELTFRAYNGAMTTDLCRRLARAIRAAGRRNTRVLVIRGEVGTTFSNGLHLGAIELARDPAREAWRNILAINAVCEEILLSRNTVTIAAMTGSAGAGGPVMAQAADIVAVINRAVLDVHYRTMGLEGSELQSLTLTRRVGAETAQRLLRECAPIDTSEALDIGLVDQVGPDIGFDTWLAESAQEFTNTSRWEPAIRRKNAQLDRDLACRPLEAYTYSELSRMADNLFNDSLGFAAKRAEFMNKRTASRPLTTPQPVGIAIR
ncbi:MULTISPECIES: enoyl-CoA hydratase-related protein [unclassified Nocardia]|uniref:enoyl-CoA hydratase-related protein n=1 Tax=unclassified Nocardia TaxID=2637762 RepID=UPI001CE48F47|nr:MULTISPECIES: enoyl-CoA hydratase-related protein [unclassified Nocardia]